MFFWENKESPYYACAVSSSSSSNSSSLLPPSGFCSTFTSHYYFDFSLIFVFNRFRAFISKVVTNDIGSRIHKMLLSPGLRTNGLFRLAPSNISPHWAHRRHAFGLHAPLPFSADWSINGRVSSKHVANFCTVSVSFARQSSSFHDELPSEPLWLRLLKDIIWSVRCLFSFMAEQPRQLKYIEWPSFTSTLRTATLSLFLVAVFIVALSSVDAALCYVLTVILRKAA